VMKFNKIGWCHFTVNFWWGCTKVSEACRNCYAASLDLMRGPLFDGGRYHWGANAPRWLRCGAATKRVQQLARMAAKLFRLRVFVNSMSDTFEDHPDLPPARLTLFSVLAAYPQLNFLLLTKRPENVRRMVPAHWLTNWPKHVWLGTTVESLEQLDRVRHLMESGCPNLFVSVEPMLGPVTFLEVPWGEPCDCCGGKVFINAYSGQVWCGGGCDGPKYFNTLKWVICGGESGKGSRPLHPTWAGNLGIECKSQGAAFYFKQWGDWLPFGMGTAYMDKFSECRLLPAIGFKDGWPVYRVGTDRAGRVLDGVIYSEFPEGLATPDKSGTVQKLGKVDSGL